MSLLDALFDQSFRTPAECAIRAGGRDLAVEGLYPLLQEVTVETSRSEAWTATLVFETRRNEQGIWDVQDKGLFVPWSRLEIDAVFGQRREAVFRGYVRECQAEYPEDAGAARFTVTCQDDSLRLDRQHWRMSWADEKNLKSDRQIVERILKEYSLGRPEVAEGQKGLADLNQDDTDIKFLRKRAQANGYELTFYPDYIYFGPPRLDAKPQPVIRVYAGAASSCLSINVREDAQQPDVVVVEIPVAEGEQAPSVKPNQTVLGREHAIGGNGLEPFAWKMQGQAADRERLEREAQTKVNEADLHRIVAEGELDGSLYGHVLQVGLTVRLDGLGDRYDGLYYVDRVSHAFSAEGYRQAFTLLRNAWGDGEYRPGLKKTTAAVTGVFAEALK